MPTKKNPLDFPKELFVYDEEYFTRLDEMESDPDLDEPETETCYVADEEIKDYYIAGTPVAKYVLVSVGKSKTVVDFQKVK